MGHWDTETLGRGNPAKERPKRCCLRWGTPHRIRAFVAAGLRHAEQPKQNGLADVAKQATMGFIRRRFDAEMVLTSYWGEGQINACLLGGIRVRCAVFPIAPR